MRIAFLGLGHMGMPMARNLLGGEHTVTVFNRTPGRARSLVDLGAIEAPTVAEAVSQAEVVVTMLADDEAIKEVVHGPEGLLRKMPDKAIHLCMATIEVETSAALASAHAKAGQGYVAGPVFGRAETARSRHIWIVAGGTEPQVNRCRPIFDALSQGYTRVGPNAALAHALKLSGNMLSMAMELAVSEIVIYAGKVGLPPVDFLRILNTAIFRSHMVDDYGKVVARPSLDPEDRTLDLAASELMYEKSKTMGLDIPPADLLKVRLQAATARGWGEQDLAALVQAFEAEAKVADPQVVITAGPTEAPPRPKRARSNLKGKSRQGPKAEPPGPPEIPPSDRPQPVGEVPASVTPSKKAETPELPFSPPTVQGGEYTALRDGVPVKLHLSQTSHFEQSQGKVWAWAEGRRHESSWRTLEEVELAFHHVMFLLIKRQVLLRPEAVLELHSLFGGRARADVGHELLLDINRGAVPKLRDMLGI